MVKLGDYHLPFKSLDSCISYLTIAHNKLKIFSIKREQFASANGIKPTGGGFGLIVGSLPMYGLAETGDGYIRYTDLAQKILFGRELEKEELKNKAVRNVRLFSEIYERYGNNPDDEQLRLFLREKANVDISKEGKIAEEVGKLFKKNVAYIKSGGGENTRMSTITTGSALKGNVAFTVTASNLRIDVDSPLKIELVKTLLKHAEKQFEPKQESSVTDLEDDSNHIEEEDSTETT